MTLREPIPHREPIPLREPIPHRRSRTVWIPAIASALFALVGVFVVAVAATTIEDLRGDSTVEAARRELALIVDEKEYLRLQLDVAKARLAEASFEHKRLDGEAKALIHEIEHLTGVLRSVAVETYVIGGNSELEFVADVATTNNLLWRHSLLSVQTDESQSALDRLSELRTSATTEVLAVVDEIPALRRTVTSLRTDMEELNRLEAAASEDLTVAEAWDRAAIAVAAQGWGIAPADKWEKLRSCESSGNHRAVSPSGRYRGTFQFDLATWRTVGGEGDPADASPEEQEARARELYARRGPDPWPVCGRFLEE